MPLIGRNPSTPGGRAGSGSSPAAAARVKRANWTPSSTQPSAKPPWTASRSR